MFARWARVLGRRRWPHLALIALIVAVAVGYGIDALRTSSSPSSSQASTSQVSSGHPSGPVVTLSSLPPQVAQTVRLIKAGGPFPYSQDGVVFDNNEHLLPSQARGYYHEYTVATPGASDRATRRIVTGRAGEYFYTDDHYESFRRVDIDR
jgi:ribonuclease T1